MNDTAQRFLDAYARGEMPPGGWLFPTALQQSRLDHSEDSLARLDHLMDAILKKVRPTREQLFDSEPGRNFCALIAFYLVEQARRRTGAYIEWFPREAAPQVLADGQPLPDEPFARLFARAPDQGVVFFPLGWVESRLMGQEAPMPAADYLDRSVARIERAGPVHWWAGMQAVGELAAWQMIMARGGAVLPTMLSAAKPRTFIAMGMPGLSGSLDDSVQQGAEQLRSNPDGARWQVLSYDGWLDGPNGQQDAVMLVLQTYGESPLALKMAFPYQPATAGRPLRILTPVIQGANQPTATLESLQGALWRGVYAMQWPDGDSWDQHRDEGARARPAAPPSAPGPVPPAPAAPVPADPAELAQILDKLRASFELRQQRMSELSLASVLAPKPDWMGPADGLNEVVARQRLLLTEGEVVWGALVMANKLLFEPGTEDLPALLVHSPDRHFDARPEALREVGQALFALKDTAPADPELARLAALITGETERALGLALPPVLCSRPVRAGVFMAYRRHVPTGVLRGGLFPVLTHPSTPAVMMLPFEFWPIELIILWKEGRL